MSPDGLEEIVMDSTPRFVGIDVSKAHLDVASRPDGQEFRLPNTPEGIASLVERLKPSPPALILLEATGGLERAAAVALAEAKLPIRVVEPGRVRHFARSIGQHSKTDAIDARVLAHYAEAVRPEARDLPDEETRDLQALLDRRRQLVAMRVSEQNRLQQGPTAAVRTDLKAHIAYLSDQIEAMDNSIGEAIQAKPEWKLRDEVLRSVPGIGPQTAQGAAGHAARVGHAEWQADLGAGGPGPSGSRQRDSARGPDDLRGPVRGADGVVHGVGLGDEVQPAAPGVLPATPGGRQGGQGGPGGGLAEAADDRQRDDPGHEALGA